MMLVSTCTEVLDYFFSIHDIPAMTSAISVAPFFKPCSSKLGVGFITLPLNINFTLKRIKLIFLIYKKMLLYIEDSHSLDHFIPFNHVVCNCKSRIPIMTYM